MAASKTSTARNSGVWVSYLVFFVILVAEDFIVRGILRLFGHTAGPFIAWFGFVVGAMFFAAYTMSKI